MPRIVNVGGSLTTALVLSAAAWGVRLLRARNILRPAERPSKPAARAPSRTLCARLHPVAFRLLLELQPFPFLLVDVRGAEEAEKRPLSACGLAASAPSVLLPEQELPVVLRPGSTAWEARFGGAVPEARLTLVFLCDDGAESERAASVAANLGFSRCSFLDGGLDALVATPAPARPPRCAYVSRNALAALQERGAGGLSAEGLLLLDVRRREERCLYGAIPGAAQLPCEQLARALAMGPEEWGRTFRFPRPHPEAPLVLHSRAELRASWAAQLLAEEGFESVFVLREGVGGWATAFPEGGAMGYPAYREGETPPAPVTGGSHGGGGVSLEAGLEEAARLGLV